MTQTTTDSDVRTLSMTVDPGGPFLLWDDQPSDKTQKGMIIDTLFCSDPECHSVHIRAILIDEHFKDAESKGVQLLSEHFDSQTKDKNLPNQSLSASFDIQTGELLVHDHIGGQSDNKELLYLLDKNINNGLSDVFKRRWRVVKQKIKEDWREKDWSWWTPGSLVSWSEVYPDDFHFVFSLCDKSYVGVDHYCITPGCTCNDVAFYFFCQDDDNELGTVFSDTKKLKVKDVRSQTSSKNDVLACWNKLNAVYPDLKTMLPKRHKELRRVGSEIAKMSGNFQAPVAVQTKVKRNDPCPCGSGKKYKRCCIDR